MSTVSGSTADTTVKYQRLSVEYAKMRNQVSVLKAALLDEKAKNEDQQLALNGAETKLRKMVGENESLTFRNAQLVKRVEALQTTLDNNNAAFLTAKNKKKHKEANLRLFGESSRQQAFHNTSDPRLVMEQELERKLVENGELHSKIFDMEKQHESLTNELAERADRLEKENSRLKKLIESRGIYASSTSRKTSGERFVEHRPSASSISSNTQKQNESQNAENGNTSGLSRGTAITTTATPTTTPTDENLNENFDRSAANFEEEDRLMENHFLEKIKNLTASLRHATGRAEYYKRECESLVRRSILDLEEKATLQTKAEELQQKCASLNDSLETTRQNYESQMRGLYEHMAEQDAKIVKQSERLSDIKLANNSNNGSGSGGNGGSEAANGSAHNAVGGGRRATEKRENGSTIGQNLRKIVGK